MATLADTTLSRRERTLLDRFLPDLQECFGERLRAVWLYGSRARGEAPAHEDSDVDLLVLVDRDTGKDWNRVYGVLNRAGQAIGDERIAIWFSVHVHDLGWLAGRREIKSFLIAEVDRDKIVLYGDPAL